MNNPSLELTCPVASNRSSLTLTVFRDHGGWTQGPYAVIESVNDVELTARELEWLVEEGGPSALARLREEELAQRAGAT